MNKSSFFYGIGVGIIITSLIFYSVLLANKNYVINEDTKVIEEVENSADESDTDVNTNENQDENTSQLEEKQPDQNTEQK